MPAIAQESKSTVEKKAKKKKRTAKKSQTGAGSERKFRSCKQAKAAGAAPLRRGQPGYSKSLDRDGDGIACEN
ncbi:excalibur calcium-binding domain-containing protein [Aquidulcibacter sp.]|uniref:excalibur calcium-binding domain-containing protein n=1 Tax=Aquidulcibacter sp. TaxID=2052990 RepID=UPI00345DD25C